MLKDCPLLVSIDERTVLVADYLVRCCWTVVMSFQFSMRIWILDGDGLLLGGRPIDTRRSDAFADRALPVASSSISRANGQVGSDAPKRKPRAVSFLAALSYAPLAVKTGTCRMI